MVGKRVFVVFVGLFLAGRVHAEPVGVYSNIVYTQDQAQGYAVHLWRDNDLYYGLLYRAAGLASDIPVGLLEGLRVTPDTKTLSFKARLSVGLVTVSGEDWVPSRDVYQFQGTLFPDQITGDMMHADMLNPNRPGVHETVTLYRSKKKEETEMMKEAPDGYKAWNLWADKILQARGPKW